MHSMRHEKLCWGDGFSTGCGGFCANIIGLVTTLVTLLAVVAPCRFNQGQAAVCHDLTQLHVSQDYTWFWMSIWDHHAFPFLKALGI